ncbi:MAG: sensor histidine kinase [Magnetococcales bacterium]|nr:sensor histidine kinase [Magnetococcales bacterium]
MNKILNAIPLWRSRPTFLFLILMVGILGVVMIYWFEELEPRLIDESESHAQALTTVMADRLSSLITTSNDGHDMSKSIQHVINHTLLLTDSNTKKPFIIRMDIEWDTAVVDLPKEQQFMTLGPDCPPCFKTDAPLLHPKTRELMGIAHFHVSNAFHAQLRDQLQSRIIWLALFQLVLILLVWRAVSVMAGRLKIYAAQLSETNEILEYKVLDRTYALTQTNEQLRDETQKRIELEKTAHQLSIELEGEERSRLATLLHDGPGQTIQTILLGLKMFNRQLETRGNTDPLAMDTLIRDTGHAIKEIRSVTRDLNPLSLEGLTLVNAIRQHCDRMRRLTGLTLDLDIQDDPDPLNQVDLENLFLMFQEILNNSVKHARAQHITITLQRFTKHRLRLTVQDDGRGFEPEQIKAGHGAGYGLSILKKRAQMLGGTLKIKSAPGKGAIVDLEVLIDD